MEHCKNEKAEQSQRIIEEGGRLSELARATLEKVKQQFSGKSLKPGTRCVMFDNSFRGYGWLLPGWIAEERRMQSGRIYRVRIKNDEFVLPIYHLWFTLHTKRYKN